MTRTDPRPAAPAPAAPPLSAGAPTGPASPELNHVVSTAEEMSPLRKAAILVVSLEQPLASQLLGQLDRSAVEAVTLEIAHLERISPAEQHAVLEEFYALGLRRLQFEFDDVIKLSDVAIRGAYHEEDIATWALALAGGSRAVRDKVLYALPRDAGEKLNRHLTLLGPFRLDDAEAAQAELAERLRRLQDHGQLTLPDANAQETMLV